MSMYDLLRTGHETAAQPWARLWDDGHGRAWLDDANYAQRHLGTLTDALMHCA